MQTNASKAKTIRPLDQFGWTALGLLFVVIAAIGVYLPGIPTTGPLLLGSYLLGKGNPALKARVLEHPLFARYRGYLDGSKPFTPALRCWAMLCMWVSILVSCLVISATSQVGWIGVPACCLGGVIGSVVILIYHPRHDESSGCGAPIKN